MGLFRQIFLGQGVRRLSRNELFQNHESLRQGVLAYLNSGPGEISSIRTSPDPDPGSHSSKTPLSSLKRITVSELKPNTVHHGRVLVCRSVANPFKRVAVQTVIEDPIVGGMEIAATRLSLYNFSNLAGPHPDLNNILPVGTRLFIKEPHYKVDDRIPIVRCESPDDVILVPNEQVDGSLLADLRWSDELPIKYGPNADNLNQRGNEQLARKDYASAIDSYTHALELNPQNAVLLSNRAQAHLHLDQFRQALEDTEAAVKIDGANTNALFRQAKALYGMRSYKEVSELFKKLNTADAEMQQLNRHTQQRLEEQQHGRYDLFDIRQEARSTRPPYLNHADYVGPVRVTEIPGKGHGMVATEEIMEGTLLLCSKAFAAVFNQELPANTQQISTDWPKNQASSLPQSHLITKITHKLQKEPWAATELYRLNAGSNIPSMPDDHTSTLDGAQVDIERITNIVNVNAFTPKAYEDGPGSQICASDGTVDAGIWISPSFFNHSCLANATLLNMGDLMFIRAIRSIAKDEEICVPYLSPYDSYDEREKILQKHGFKCHCPLCEFERAQPEATRRRGRLLDEYKGICDAIKKNDLAMIPRLVRIINELSETYQTASTATTTCASGPRTRRKVVTASTTTTPHQFQFGMFHPLSALYYLHRCNDQPQKAAQVMIEAFKMLPRYAGIADTRAKAALAIWETCKLANMDEQTRWLELAKKEHELLFGPGTNWQALQECRWACDGNQM